VPEFCQKDVPPAKFLGILTARTVVFDPLASRYETKIADWRWRPEGTPAAVWNKAIDRWAFRLSDLIIADTQAHKEYYCRRFSLKPENVIVIPVGFDDRVFQRSLAQRLRPSAGDGRPFVVLFFGSFLPLHGVETVVDAAGAVSRKDETILFELIGSGQTLERVQRLTADSGLRNIRFTGWMDPAALARRIAAEADVCLGIFGLTEKAGRVVPHKIFQSMALGKAVITGRTPAAEEVFSHRRNIFFCDRGKPESLAGAVLELKRDAELREQIARSGCELAWEKFHPQAIGARLIDVLRTWR